MSNDVKVLCKAAGEGNFELVEVLLIENPTLAKQAMDDGWTALHYAAYRAQVPFHVFSEQNPAIFEEWNLRTYPIAALLISKGADVNALTRMGCCPLWYSVNRGDYRLTRLLLDNGADANMVGCEMIRPLHLAASKGHSAIAHLLLERGADINASEECGNTALHMAAKNGQEGMVRYLVCAHANVDVFNISGKTPLECAKEMLSPPDEHYVLSVRSLLARGKKGSTAALSVGN